MATSVYAVPEDGEAAPSTTHGDMNIVLSPDLHMLSYPTGPQSESVRVLRTHLTSQHLRDGRRTLAICSTARGTGCTYIATNLALSFAQTQMKVLLIDCNLRDPGVDGLISMPRQVDGLAQYLADPATFSAKDVISKDVMPNLSILYAGGTTDSTQELLGGNAFKTLLDECVRDYDLTIVDTPAANICSDARQICAMLRYALVVTRRNHSYVKDVRTFIDELRGDRVNVVGTYLNDY